MRRLIYMLFAAALMTGCRMDKGEEFEPTRLGYDLTRCTSDVLWSMSDEVITLLHFSDYIKADGEERERLHDKWFYTSRIVEREDGAWSIINSNSELKIFTNGKTLDEADAEWEFYSGNATHTDGDVPTISHTGTDSNGSEQYTLHFPGHKYALYTSVRPANYRNYYGDVKVTVMPYEIITGGEKDDGTACIFDGVFTFYVSPYSFGTEYCCATVLSPVEYRPAERDIRSGRLALAIDVDGNVKSPEVEFLGGSKVKVFGGKDNAYSRTYDLNSYYYYYE